MLLVATFCFPVPRVAAQVPKTTPMERGDPNDIGSPLKGDPVAPAGRLMTSRQATATVQSLFDFAIERSPREYTGKKNWEKTKKIWAGVRFRRDGLRLSTKRRWREVRHGRQTNYRVSFPGPATSQPPLSAKVHSVNYSDGKADEKPGWLIDCELATPLDFSARIERWNLGVQWYSVEVSGHLNVRLRLQGHLGAYPDYSDIPPAIVIDPRVTSAALTLESLSVDRVSKIGGEVAEQWGEIAEAIIKEILIDDINGKLPTKLNRAIEKNRDDLRFSASDWVEQLTGG